MAAALQGSGKGAEWMAGNRFFFALETEAPGSWPAILSSAGLLPGKSGRSAVTVLGDASRADAEEWRARLEAGELAVIEGGSPFAEHFGIRAGERRVAVRNVKSHRRPDLAVIWEKECELPVFEIPPDAELFAEDRWSGAPLAAGVRVGAGGLLWVAVSPGTKGHERFPYLLHALTELGMEPPFRSRNLWAFFDSSYRMRVDLAYFAKRWRQAGIGALHVAAWHFFEPDEDRDAYLHRLVEECHRNAIQVYAWIEFPHVSEQFWHHHPEWREKTAALQDAHLDWRKLMNLADPDCARAAAEGLHALLERFDWDGVNLAELYFESLEGHENPARFTPMNDVVRAEFQALQGVDPLTLFSDGEAGPEHLRAFLDYRAGLAQRLQEHWIREIERARRHKPHLDLVLTHVDDRADPRMRDLIGADTTRLLPLLDRYDFTFLIEDPATVWDRDPSRYSDIAAAYRPLTPRQDRLAIDINIVERYQDVYPTKQQTGTELLHQLHLAATQFPRVAVYAEHSLLRDDLELLPSALAGVNRLEDGGRRYVVDSPRGVGIPWQGGALVDGQVWPFLDGETLWVPAGTHVLEPYSRMPAVRLLDFNGEVQAAVVESACTEIAYRSESRAFARIAPSISRMQVDGIDEGFTVIERAAGLLVALPRGQHLARFCLDRISD